MTTSVGLTSAQPRSGVENIEPAIESLSGERAVPDWLLTIRESGASHMLREGLPTRAVEEWKYTSLAPLLDGAWEVAEAFADDELPDRTLFPRFAGESSGEIVLLNGKFIPQWSKVPDRVVVRPSSEVEAPPQLAQFVPSPATYETKVVSLQKPAKWTATTGTPARSPVQVSLNASLLRDMYVIEIEKGTILKKPLVISSFTFGTESLTKWSAVAPRVAINVAQGCDVALVEMSAGEGRTVHIPVTTVTVAKGSRLSHARLQLNQASAVQLGYTQISLSRDSFCETYQFTLGGRISREDLDIHLTETGAEALLDGLYLADGKRHVDHSTTVEHQAPNTTSSQLYKGILNDEGRAVFNGRVLIRRAAQKSNAAQLNNNLLLSKRAEIDTKPELEIDADDVKASHGATIGQIDPEHVFYLRARAIPEVDAIKMLSKGFAQDVAFRIQNEAIRKGAETVVSAALAKSSLAGGV